jgi:hypothetical protein
MHLLALLRHADLLMPTTTGMAAAARLLLDAHLRGSETAAAVTATTAIELRTTATAVSATAAAAAVERRGTAASATAVRSATASTLRTATAAVRVAAAAARRTTAAAGVGITTSATTTVAATGTCISRGGDRQRGNAGGEKHPGQHEKSPFERRQTARSLHRSNR